MLQVGYRYLVLPHEEKWIIAPYEQIESELSKYNLTLQEDIVPPEPYKGKGVRYSDERIVRKEAKKS